MRREVGRWAEKAKRESGQPSAADVETLRSLWNRREEFLADGLKSNFDVKWRTDPDWKSWPSIADAFVAYRVALVDLDHGEAPRREADRLSGYKGAG